jgi:hypothetical protein
MKHHLSNKNTHEKVAFEILPGISISRTHVTLSAVEVPAKTSCFAKDCENEKNWLGLRLRSA